MNNLGVTRKQADPFASLSLYSNPSKPWKKKHTYVKMKQTSSVTVTTTAAATTRSTTALTTKSNNRASSVAVATCFPAEVANPDQMQYHHHHHRLGTFPNGPMRPMKSFNGWRDKDNKVVVVMGATGTGKSRLSIDLAARFNAEVINSDKIQVYKGLDIVTNKVSEEEKLGIRHHLLGEVPPDDDFSAAQFRRSAHCAIASILDRNRLPIIAGGSNSFVEALIDDEELSFRSNYDCCFIWVDVPLPILYPSLDRRVDRMVDAGLVDEVRQIFDPQADYTKGIRRAIGVPELDDYLRLERELVLSNVHENESLRSLKGLLDEAIEKIKVRTCELACRQLKKIRRLYRKWDVSTEHRVDASEVFRCRGRETDEVWDRTVMAPTSRIVAEFLFGNKRVPANAIGGAAAKSPVAPIGTTAVLAGAKR
ncbi:hypothetical protein Sjap_007778 [Stephania japonica]|uniref:adenylate dimethylallyltransferase (ADP/ATP-dependent) n=1 Tax=Stephania japonica TaxID=461633 RepID=A0AAP0PBN1_9MAGN